MFKTKEIVILVHVGFNCKDNCSDFYNFLLSLARDLDAVGQFRYTLFRIELEGFL